MGEACCIIVLGECQEVLVAGELMGVVSSFMLLAESAKVGVEADWAAEKGVGLPFVDCSSSCVGASGLRSMCPQYFFSILTMPSLVNGLARMSFIPGARIIVSTSCLHPARSEDELTPLIVSSHVLRANVRCHCDYGHMGIHSSYIDSCRDAVAYWHDDVHENQIKAFRFLRQLVGRNLAVFLQLPRRCQH